MENVEAFKLAVQAKDAPKASSLLQGLKEALMSLDSLPPIRLETPNATAERIAAREVLEYAVMLSVILQDKDDFQRYMSMLKPYYTGFEAAVTDSDNKYMIIGLNLLYLIVENRLSEFHCELELLSEEEKAVESIRFCLQLEQRLMVGAYDQVTQAASKPPSHLYSFFLKSLLETVRVSIAECAEASYATLSLASAKEILMFDSETEAREFLTEKCSHWAESSSGHFRLKEPTPEAPSAEDVPSQELISQVLSYASEMDRIV